MIFPLLNFIKGIGRGRFTINYNIISYDNVQGVGSKLYFQSFYSNRPYYCTILAMGNFDCCMSELKKYEGLTIKYPLCVHDYMVSKDYLWMLKDPSRENSCRSEPIHYHLDAEKVMAEFNLNEKRAIEKSVQQKRGPTNRQLLLCANKRFKK